MSAELQSVSRAEGALQELKHRQAGFVQTKLMAQHGLLPGAMLTAVPVFAIHLPLSYETNGLYGTRWEHSLINWGLLLVALPAFRYLAGVLMLETNGSVLAVGVLHASFNASGGMDVVPGGWQYVPAVILLTVLVAGYRALLAQLGHRVAE